MRRRWLLRFALLAALLAGATWLLLAHGRGRVAEFQAALDRDEPGWLWADLRDEYESRLAPPGTGPMPVVRTAAGGGSGFTRWLYTRSNASGDPGDWLPEAEPNRRPPRLLDGEVGCRRDDLLPTIEPARGLVTQTGPAGTRLTHSIDSVGTLVPHLDDVRITAELLRLDAATFALRGDGDSALRSARAGLGVGRAVGPEPFGVSLLTRRWAARLAADAVERTLGLTEPTAELAELQAELLGEADAPSLRMVARCERATLNELYDNFRTGRDSVSAFISRYAIGTKLPNVVHSVRFRLQMSGEHLWVLESTTAYVRAAEAPEHEQLARAAALPPVSSGGSVVAQLVRGFGINFSHARFVELDLYGKARLRAAAVGVACERFRLANGRWPNDLSELGSLLPVVPNDPFTGKPLIYRRVPGGAVVYAVGPDGVDDAGNIGDDRTATKPSVTGIDVGFRLFDPARRNLPPTEDDE